MSASRNQGGGRIRPPNNHEPQQQSSASSIVTAQSVALIDGDCINFAAIPPSSAHTAVVAAAADDDDDADGLQPLPGQFQRPRLRSCIDHLAAVELQLVLQCLGAESKLKAARCSRRLLQAADHPFAWKGAAPFRILSNEHARPGTLISRSLLRHTPITLQLDSALPASDVALIPRLCELVVRFYGRDSVDVALLALPALQGLQILQLHWDAPASALQRLPTLPQLRTLHLVYSWHDDRDDRDWTWLPAMPALADLHLNLPVGFPLSLMDAVGQCTRLQSLQLLCDLFTPGDFSRLCSTPAMRQLRHLQLDLWSSATLPLCAEELGAGLSSLASLTSLRLDRDGGVDCVLPQLALAPALRTLVIPCSADELHPSGEVLRQLLTAAPRLRVQLQMAATVEQWSGGLHSFARDHELIGKQWQRLQRMAAEMERVTIIHE